MQRKPEPIEEHADPGVEPACVLLAEDDDELRRLLARALRRDGYRVIESEDGTELLEVLAKDLAQCGVLQEVDLIVSDIRMPGYTGLNVLCGLRQAGVQVPVIVMTAFGDSDTIDRAHKLGAYCVLDKPFETETLRHAVLASLSEHVPAHVPVQFRY